MRDHDPNRLSIAQDLTGARSVGSDEFLYDIFGVNIKGLKSIWTLIRRPVEYFEAARLPDWGGDHWPSIRIWLGLMGLLVALQFLWASESSEMTAMFQTLASIPGDTLKERAASDGFTIDLSELDRQALGKQAFKLWIFIYPLFFIAAMCLLALIFRAWKPAIGYVVRLRYIFAIIVPGSVFGLFLTLILVNVSGEVYQMVSFLSIPGMIILYAITAFRGPFHTFDRGERLGMSLIVALLIMVFLFASQTISMLLAVAPTWVEVYDILRPQMDAYREVRDAAKSVSP